MDIVSVVTQMRNIIINLDSSLEGTVNHKILLIDNVLTDGNLDLGRTL